MPAVDGELGVAGREVFHGVTMELVRLRAGLKFAPFPGEEYFHFAVNGLHGHRVLIGAAQVFLHENNGGHERKSGNGKDADGDERFRDQRAALSVPTGSASRAGR